jgi:SOS-response transcriptional repressor LexA
MRLVKRTTPTETQELVLEAFRPSPSGEIPSFRQVAKKLGGRSLYAIHRHVRIMEERGYIEREPGKPRSVRVLWDAPK